MLEVRQEGFGFAREFAGVHWTGHWPRTSVEMSDGCVMIQTTMRRGLVGHGNAVQCGMIMTTWMSEDWSVNDLIRRMMRNF